MRFWPHGLLFSDLVHCLGDLVISCRSFFYVVLAVTCCCLAIIICACMMVSPYVLFCAGAGRKVLACVLLLGCVAFSLVFVVAS